MIRILFLLILVFLAAAGLHWLADRPGNVTVEWQGYIAETSVFRAIVLLALAATAAVLVYGLLRQIWRSPAIVGRMLRRQREQRGLDALSSGIIAVGAGDQALALRYAGQARKALPNEPLTHLLRAQAAQITGDRATARRIFEAMLGAPDTEQLGLRGLFLEAEREGDQEAARQFAERALAVNPRLGWPLEAIFDLQCRAEQWQGALDTLALAQRHHLIDKTVANRRRAVLLTAQAQMAEESAADSALDLALEAHRLAPDLVPAAAIAGRVLAARGSTPKAARVLLKTWRLSPHPELAVAYAYARPGDSPRDRLTRVRHLGRLTPNDSEALIAIAIAAIEAREYEEARKVLEPMLKDRLTQRVCTLMARIEGEQHGDAGRVREWLARAVNAARDPAWTADGMVSDHWAATSPVTGALDAFQWRVPVEAIDQPAASLAAKVEALVGLGAGPEPALERARPAARLPAATAEVATPEPGVPETAIEPIVPPAARPSPPPAPPPITEDVTPGPAAEPAKENTSRQEPGTEPRDPAPPARERNRPTDAVARSVEQKEWPRASPEPRIFVPPRAPDDPGPEASEDEFSGAGFPASGAKA
ncbi:MAG TPA: heme biosynthesis HemY N-terminal domain-containing protein [Hyphomicrobiaceae bacterium]|nr:heme biosynthesis HemY N-terminal domain-containing protein [Hyphomicrobiaceae bacterium]